jgi:hypothetical protein
VFPNAKKLTGAVINDPKGRIYVDSTLYYYGTKNEGEAFYLCGMLNIPDLAKSVKIISDTRHHHKRPLYFNIPKFNSTKEQLSIATISKECYEKVEKYVIKHKKLKETEIANLISDELKAIRDIGINILCSASPTQVIQQYKFQ